MAFRVAWQDIRQQDGSAPQRHADIQSTAASRFQLAELFLKLPGQDSDTFQITHIDFSCLS